MTERMPNLRTQQRALRRRTVARRTLWGAAAIAGLVLVALGGAWWLSGHGSRSTTSRASSQVVAAGRVKQTAGTPSATPRPAASSSVGESVATTSGLSAETLAAASASLNADAKAAQPVPGARPIAADTPSLSQFTPRHKYVALTFDDGYHFDPRMVELLERYDVHCTTFIIGSWAATHLQDVRMMKDAGLEIANHTWSHPFLSKLSTSQIQTELSRQRNVIASVTGVEAPYLRPPYGDTDPKVKAAAAALGYRIVLWNRTFGEEGGGHLSAAHVTKILTRTGPIQAGDIILAHWGAQGTYQALQKLLPQWQAEGFQFVTISELIADSQQSR